MKILITGGTGMVGSAFKKINSEHEFVFVGSKDYNLVSEDQTDAMVRDVSPDAIVHLAAKVGGVKGNTVYVNDFFNQNIMMNTNILQIAHRHNIQKVISFLSTCVYPDKVRYPLTEDQIHNGPPHMSNFGYAYAKRMVDVHSRAMRQQNNRNYICAIPNNLYGPHDNFDLENGHVIPAIIRKVHEAKLTSKPPMFWGSGFPLREFTYSEDIASILLFLLDNYDDAMPINIGNPTEISIKQIVGIISNILDYNGEIIWDTDKPEGQFRKPSSNERLREICPELEYTSLQSGLEQTCEWFLQAYPNVRGVK